MRTAGVLLVIWLALAGGCGKRQLTPLEVFRNPQADSAAVRTARRGLESNPITESPRFWVDIVNDNRFPEWHRREAMLEFFERHATPPASVSLFERSGASSWFTRSNLFLPLPKGGLPFKPLDGAGPVLLFVPALLQKTGLRIYIQIAEKVDVGFAAESIRGDRAGEGLRMSIMVIAGRNTLDGG